MPYPQISLDLARSMLVCGNQQVRIPSRTGALFLQALRSKSSQGLGLTFDGWAHQLRCLGHPAPDRTGMRRLLLEMARCFEALGWEGNRPVVLAPLRGTTVGPWRLSEDLCERLVVLQSDERVVMKGMARLTLTNEECAAQLRVLNCFLVGDDLARNGMFADAAASMAKALPIPELSPELRCVLYLRKVKYLRRAGQFAEARADLCHANILAPALGVPMRGHVQAELAVQGWRLRYDDVAQADQYGAYKAPSVSVDSDFHGAPVDSRLLWQQFNLWASEWRRQMEACNLSAVQVAFSHARNGYEAAIYWALVSEDALNVMNVAANMGYLLHLSGQKKLADLSVQAIDWLLLSQAYIERFEWPEESLWDHVYLAELYLSSASVREHLKAKSAYVMNALTPDCEGFYTHALALGIRLGEPRQLANMYQLFIQYLESVGQYKKAQAQACLLDALLDQHPGLRENLSPTPRRAVRVRAAKSR